MKLNEKAKDKGFIIPVSVTEQLTKALGESSTDQSEIIIKSFDAILDVQLVALGERGAAGGVDHTPKDKTVELQAAIKKLQEANKDMSYSAALIEVSRTNPELSLQYREESYAGGN